MQFLVGIIVLLVSVLVPFVLIGGSLKALMQPAEYAILIGAAIAAFIIANPTSIIFHTLHHLKLLFSPKIYKKDSYIELLMFIFNLFKHIQSKGILSIEKDLDDPTNSDLFKNYPSVIENKRAVIFCCDYLRIINMGLEDKYQMEDLINADIELMISEDQHSVHAVQNISDSFPALGIVAAVLGVIKAMAAINEPPEVLGAMIGGALVGTFVGVLCAYGFIGPMAQFIDKVIVGKFKYVNCIKASIIAYMQENPAQIIAEIARKEIPEDVRPSFAELEAAMYEKK